MKIKLFIAFVLFSCCSAFSQDARTILDKVAKNYSDPSGYIVSFTLNTEDVAAKTTYTQDGKVYMKGNKFKIDTADGITWFDGKTQWLYMEESGEVNVTNPTGEELMAISPMALLGMYKTGFNLSSKGLVKDKGKSVYLIEMIPQKKGSDISKFVLKIDPSSYLFSEITMNSTNGYNNHLIAKKNEPASSLTDGFFVFNKKDFPNVEIIDLR